MAAARAATPEADPKADAARRAAHEDYEQGKSAMEGRDYLRAATLFLDAYRLAPHYDSLWNAARALELGGERASAANLYSRYLDEAPAPALDRDRATALRQGLATFLGRIEVRAPNVTAVRVDGEPLRGQSVFVNPGQHVVDGQSDGRAVRTTCVAVAGLVTSVELEALPIAPAQAPVTPPSSSNGRVLPPLVVYVGAGLTGVLAGFTTWSGLETLQAKQQYNANPSAANDAEGKNREGRTNVLFWTTAGVGVLTGAAAIGFVRWPGSSASSQLGVGPRSFRIEGTF